MSKIQFKVFLCVFFGSKSIHGQSQEGLSNIVYWNCPTQLPVVENALSPARNLCIPNTFWSAFSVLPSNVPSLACATARRLAAWNTDIWNERFRRCCHKCWCRFWHWRWCLLPLDSERWKRKIRNPLDKESHSTGMFDSCNYLDWEMNG